MAKQTVSKKNTQITHSHGRGIQHEQTEVFDDNLLPDASEIKALSEMDPNILDWLKAQAEKEQQFRHQAFNAKLESFNYHAKEETSTNKLGMTYAFCIIISGIFLSAFLIHLGQVLTGTIFSGVTLTFSAALFIRRRKTEEAKQQ